MTDGILKATSSLRIGETQTAHRCDDMKKDRTRSTAKILFVVGDAVDCHDAMVPFQMFSLMGHVVHAVSPGKRAGETVMTRISSPVSDWNRREKNERPFALTASFADIDPCDYDGLVIACGQPVGDAGFDRIVLSTVRSFAADGRQQ
jgi:protease I